MARILIVDDEDDIRDLIKEVLETEGHEVFSALDGAQALKFLDEKTADLVIMDRNMPRMTGIEAIRRLRGDPRTAKLKILMCTTSSVPREVDEAFAAGADGYVLKPLNVVQLTAQVAKALRPPAS